MYEIWRLKRLTIKRRAKQGLPPIEDPNDLPDPRQQEEYVSVLNEKEQQQLDTHQQAFAKSQTWYKPHATATHKAYPINYALANTFVSTNVYWPLSTRIGALISASSLWWATLPSSVFSVDVCGA